MSDLHSRTLYLLHDGDSYEIIVNGSNTILEIWRYAGNHTCKPEFCLLEWLDETVQDRIYDKLSRNLE